MNFSTINKVFDLTKLQNRSTVEYCSCVAFSIPEVEYLRYIFSFLFRVKRGLQSLCRDLLPEIR